MFRILRPSFNLLQKQLKITQTLTITHSPKVQNFHTSQISMNDKDKPKELELVEDNFATRLYKKMFSGVPMAKLKASGYILVTYCTQRTDIVGFFETFDMPDTFYSWFLITELHIWLIGARLMSEGDAGRAVRNAMVEALWLDCDNRAKAIGDMASSMRSKNIAAIAEEFQAALFIYDEGLVGNDMQLANALWRRFFLSMKEVEADSSQLPDPEKILLLVNYVRRVANYLDKADAVDIIVSTKIEWPPLIEKK